MLTKELLRFRIRDGRVHPQFVEPNDQAALRCAQGLVAVFDGAVSKPLGETVDEAHAEGPLGAGLRKLLLDACEIEPEDPEVESRRWAALEAAARRRRAPDVGEEDGDDVEQYRRSIAEELDRPFDEVKLGLYGDLPDRRKVIAREQTSPEALLRRYNVALVQGLLLQAREVEVSIIGAGTAEKRMLFRQLKFHRLLADVRAEGASKALKFQLGGPLSMFDQASAYGLRLANFFPNLLRLTRWSLEATVKVKGREARLKLDQKSQLSTLDTRAASYEPPEFAEFIKAFNERDVGWKAALADDFVHIGRESYCFPDITISSRSDEHGASEQIHVELFHRWHASQLEGRIQALEKNPISTLRLGVSKNLARSESSQRLLRGSRWFAKYGFVFSDFPTPKAILPLL